MEQMTVHELLDRIKKEVDSLRTENHLGGHDYDSFRHKKECDRLMNLYNEVSYFKREYC